MFPRFDIPLKSEREPNLLYYSWGEITDAYEKKNYKAEIYQIIKYFNQEVAKQIEPEKDINLEVKHANILLKIKVNDNGFSIKAPFLKITEDTNTIALLRKISEINFDSLNLPQIILADEILSFSYACPLELCRPSKILDIIKDICYQGDYFSPELKENYNAVYFINPSRKDLSANEKNNILESIRNILTDYDNCMQFFEKERLNEYYWDIITITLLKLENMPYFNGTLRNRLFDNLNLMYSDNEMNFRIDRAMAFIKELKAKTDEDLINCLYYANIFCSRLNFINQEKLTEYIENDRKRLEKLKQENRYLAITYDIYERLLNIIYLYNIDHRTKNKIYEALNQIKPNTPWKKASDILYELYFGLQKAKNKKKFNLLRLLQIIALIYIAIRILTVILEKN